MIMRMGRVLGEFVTGAMLLFALSTGPAAGAVINLSTDLGLEAFDTNNFATSLADSSCSATCLTFGSGIGVTLGPFTTAQIEPLLIGSDLSRGVALGQGPAGGVADFVTPAFGSLASIANGAGADFVIWEAGAPAEQVLVSVSLGGGSFTSPISYATIVASPPDSSSGYATNSVHIDLTDFGVAANALIDEVRISGLFTGIGGSGPDILAVAALNAGPPTIPEPTTIALFGIGLAGLGFSRRRKRA